MTLCDDKVRSALTKTCMMNGNVMGITNSKSHVRLSAFFWKMFTDLHQRNTRNICHLNDGSRRPCPNINANVDVPPRFNTDMLLGLIWIHDILKLPDKVVTARRSLYCPWSQHTSHRRMSKPNHCLIDMKL